MFVLYMFSEWIHTDPVFQLSTTKQLLRYLFRKNYVKWKHLQYKYRQQN